MTRSGLDKAAGGDEVFKQLVLAGIIEPTSKEDSIRVIQETGHQSASYPTIKRSLPGYAAASWRGASKSRPRARRRCRWGRRA